MAELLPRLRNKDEQARIRIIEGYMRLAASIASRYAGYYPWKKQELVAVAWETVVEAVDRVFNGLSMQEHDELSKYIHKYVRGQILTYLKTDFVVRPPLNSQWILDLINKEGVSALKNRFECERLVEDQESTNLWHEDETTCTNFNSYNSPTAEAPKQDFNFTEKELLSSDWFTNQERKIMTMRNKGYNNRQIAMSIGYSEARIGQILKEMKGRAKTFLKGEI